MHAVTVGPLGEREQRALASGRTEDLLGAGESATPALNGGYQLAFFTASAVAAAALALAAVLLRTPRRAATHEAPASAPPSAPTTAPAAAQPDGA
jgi:hypothetical protein